MRLIHAKLFCIYFARSNLLGQDIFLDLIQHIFVGCQWGKKSIENALKQYLSFKAYAVL